jgi:hypothetical protein
MSAGAQETGRATQLDYSAGKTPAQLFTTDCASCHKSPQGLARGKDQSALASFLRAHYTTKPATAGALAAYLSSVGAGSARAPAAERRPARAEPVEQKPRHPTASGERKPADEDGAAKPRARAAEGKPARAPKPAPTTSEKDAPDGEGTAAASPTQADSAAGEQPRPHAAVRPAGRNRDSAAPPRPRATVPGDGIAASTSGKPKPGTARTPRQARHAPAEDAKLKSYATSGDTAKPADGEPSEVDRSLNSYARSGADAPTAARERANEHGAGPASGDAPAQRERDSRAAQAPSDPPVAAVQSEAAPSPSADQTGTLPSTPKPVEQSPASSTPEPADAPPSAASGPSIDR